MGTAIFAEKEHFCLFCEKGDILLKEIYNVEKDEILKLKGTLAKGVEMTTVGFLNYPCIILV
jgi:hypothetical protein